MVEDARAEDARADGAIERGVAGGSRSPGGSRPPDGSTEGSGSPEGSGPHEGSSPHEGSHPPAPGAGSNAADTDPSGLEPTSIDTDTGARRVFRAQLTALCERWLGAEAVGFAFPGGTRRDSCRITLSDGRSVIATMRDEPDRADLETRVLAALEVQGASAPRVLAANRRVLVQEDCGETRLSVALHRADPAEAERLLDRALASLAALQAAGARAGLAERVPLLGVAGWWIESLIDRPVALGSMLDVEPPVPEIEHLRDLLAVAEPCFVKWDARPANAVVDADGAVTWIDFEHCGARNPLDDLAWLMADEYVPHDPARDKRLLAAHAPALGGSLPAPLLPHYARAMLVLHGTHRLNLMIDGHGGEGGRGWRDAERCVRRDSVGVTLAFALRQCDRLEHHAAQSSLTAALAPFYATCRERIEAL